MVTNKAPSSTRGAIRGSHWDRVTSRAAHLHTQPWQQPEFKDMPQAVTSHVQIMYYNCTARDCGRRHSSVAKNTASGDRLLGFKYQSLR